MKIEKKEKRVKITVSIPQRKLSLLIIERGNAESKGEELRNLIDEEIERMSSLKAHQKIYALASTKDFR